MNRIPIYAGLLLISGGIFAFAKFFIGSFGVIDPINSIFAVAVAIFAGYVLLSAYEVLDFTLASRQVRTKATILFISFMIVEAAGYSFFSYSSIFDDEKTRLKLAAEIDQAFDKQNERNSAFINAVRKDIGENVKIAVGKSAYISIEKTSKGYESISGILETKNKLDRQVFNDYVYHKTEIADSKNSLAFFNDIAENTSKTTAVILLVSLCTAFGTLLTFGLRFVNLRRTDNIKTNPNLIENDKVFEEEKEPESDKVFEEDDIDLTRELYDAVDSVETAEDNDSPGDAPRSESFVQNNDALYDARNDSDNPKKRKFTDKQKKIMKMIKSGNYNLPNGKPNKSEIARILKCERKTVQLNIIKLNGELTDG